MGLILKIVLGALLALIGHRVFEVITLMGFHIHIKPHSPGPCHLVPGVDEGSEDFEILPDGIAIVTSGLRWHDNINDPNFKDRKGRFLLVDLNNVRAGAKEIPIEGTPVTNPLGISIWMDRPDDPYPKIFAVDNKDGKRLIEKYKFDRARRVLVHERSIEDPLFIHPNDLLATGPDSFYLNNFVGSPQKILLKLEQYLGLHRSSIVHYDGKKASYIVEGISTSNGLAFSPDKRFLYTTSTLTRSLLVYKVNPDFTLDFHKSFTLYTILENVTVNKKTGDIWIGALPVGYKLLGHFSDPSKPAPSQVLRLKMKDGNMEHFEEVYIENGEKISASTVADIYNGRLLIGSVWTKLLYCDVKYLD